MCDPLDPGLQERLEADLDLPIWALIAWHLEIAPQTIHRRHASVRRTLMDWLNKRAERIFVSWTLGIPANGGCQGFGWGQIKMPELQASQAAMNTLQVHAA